ncbi:MAG: S8 family serine peptidase [Actinomycetota bacterium]
MKARARVPALAAAVAAIAASLAMAASSAPAKLAPSPHPAAERSLFGQEVMPGEVIVRFERGTPSFAREAAKDDAGASHKRKLLLSRTELVEVTPGSEKEAAAMLERDPNVLYAEPNAIVHEEAPPNDTRFTDLWAFHNTGQQVNGGTGLEDADIDAPEAFNMGVGLGSSLRVAVVDSGVVAGHPDLAANMFINPGEFGAGKATNGIDDDGNGKVDDYRGWDFAYNDNNPTTFRDHGTHVAGTLAAHANNGLGVAGVASFQAPAGSWPGPKILAVKVLNEEGFGTVAQVANGLVYAGMMNARVANVSLGFAGTSATLDNAIKSRPNTLYVVAAGNDGVNNDTSPHTPCRPASAPDAANKICVGATTSSDTLAGFSNFGAVNVDLAAPGVSILSTVPTKTVFSDNFETPIAGRWKTDDAGQTGAHRWGATTAFSSSPTHSITDSRGGLYENNQDNWARNTTGFNLTGSNHCRVTAQVKIDTEDNFDTFTIQVTRTPGLAASWQTAFAFNGAATGPVTANLPAAFSGQTGVFVRFRLNSDGSNRDDGVYVDDVALKCRTNAFNATSYGFLNGTSMAAPHVAGAAAFLFTKFPAATVAQVKDKILRSADRKGSLTGRVTTGGRLNLYKAAAESTADVSGGVLRFTAGTGQKNNVTATRVVAGGVPKYRIADPYSTIATKTHQWGSRINPGAGCARVNDTTVDCPVAGITRIVLSGLDHDDTLNAGTIAISVTLAGGAGTDILTGGTANDSLSGGANPDVFAAGTGDDTISARHEDVDSIFNCGENAGDNDTVNADLAPNDPVVADAANCEVVNKQ